MSKQYLLYLLLLLIIVLCVILYYLYTIKPIKKRVFREINSKCLVVIYGESFNTHDHDQKINYNNLYTQQKIATLSHIDLINNIHWKYKIDSDVILSTKSNHYKNEIKTWFNEYLWSKKAKVKTLINKMEGDTLENIFKDIKRKYIEQYRFVLFIKCDAYLKPAFFDIFDPHSRKITFTTRHNVYDHSINNTTVYIPHRNFNKMIEDGYANRLTKNLNQNVDEVVKEYNLKDEHGVGFMIDEGYVNEKYDIDTSKDWKGYDIDTSKAWNPLYRTVNKPEKSQHSM